MPFNLTSGQFLFPGTTTPIASGVLTLTLEGGPATIIATGATAPSSYTFTLSSAGIIAGTAQVYGNSELSPAGTYYQATVSVSSVTVWGPTNWAVGTAALYSGNLFPNVTVLPYGGGGGSGGGGTVTSVGLSVPSGLTVSGSPITTSGTISIGGILALANGGTGTSSPSLVGGTGISVSGSFPNQTITATGTSYGTFAWEVPSGSGTGTSTLTLANTPNGNVLILFRNGSAQSPTSGVDFTRSGSTITLVVAGTTSDTFFCFYTH